MGQASTELGPDVVVAAVRELAQALGRIPTPGEVKRALADRGLSASAAVAGLVQHGAPPARDRPSVAAAGSTSEDRAAPRTAVPDPSPTQTPAEDAWWDDVIDFGDDAHREDSNEGVLQDGAVQRALDDMTAEWKRAGGRIAETAVHLLLGRSALDANQRSAVLNTLLERGIVPEAPAAEVVPNEDLDFDGDAYRDSLGLYLASVGRHRLIRPEEEVELGRLVRIGQRAQEALRSSEGLNEADRLRLEREVRAGEDARDRFAAANLRLVVKMARERIVVAPGLDLLDLIQCGNLGLLHAIDKFDPELGYKFSTYATWWIRQALDREIGNTARLIRIPIHMLEKVNKVRAASRRLRNAGQAATPVDIAALTGLEPGDVAFVQQIDREPVSLDAPIGDGDATLADVVGAATSEPSAFAQVWHEEARRLLTVTLVARVGWRAADVILRRTGLDGGDAMTLDSIGEIFGVTRERIRQIEKKALEQLRAEATMLGLRELLEADL